MSPQRQSLVLTATLGVSVTTMFGMFAAAVVLGSKLERLDAAVSSGVTIHDASAWVAKTERINTNGWCGADIWTIWERNHSERQSVLGRMP